MIEILLSNPSVTLLVLGFVVALLSVGRKIKKHSWPMVIEKLTAYFFLFSIGIGYLYNFVMHVFFAEFTANFIGWANSPFQKEVGFVSLGIGIAGVFAFKRKLPFRIATFLPPAFFLWGAAANHIFLIIKTHNLSPGNAGSILWTDLLLPFIGLALLYGQWKTSKKPIQKS
ncbi:MAG: hypothetical protein JW798_13980 [Prolixibacteraceae bacterium]|nr:hypothetical protein [Prolixibacteraceae bacterium]